MDILDLKASAVIAALTEVAKRCLDLAIQKAIEGEYAEREGYLQDLHHCVTLIDQLCSTLREAKKLTDESE